MACSRRLRTSSGFNGYKLSDMDEIADVAAPYYNNDLRGGEGHMEVGKLIVNVAHNKANMTLSVKPFGCMPSSGVSDGVQSLITEKFPGTIFCAVETSGDGAVNFYSRVQMYLFKAKQVAEKEVADALEATGMTHGRGSGLHRRASPIQPSVPQGTAQGGLDRRRYHLRSRRSTRTRLASSAR